MTHHAPEESRTGFQRVADYGILVALTFPMVLGLMAFMDFLQIRECPVGTFQAGPLHADYFLLGLLAVTLPLVFGTQHIFYHLVPITQKWLNVRLRCTPRWHFILGGATFTIVTAGAITIWITAFSQYCLSNQGILHREMPWRNFQTHQWADISAIETVCTRGARGGANVSYFVSMKDGTTIDINDMRKLEENWSRFQQHLRGVSFSFDAEAVAPDCPAPRADLLRIRP